jgi:hypothetical protein
LPKPTLLDSTAGADVPPRQPDPVILE